jgi:hypothetical protein
MLLKFLIKLQKYNLGEYINEVGECPLFFIAFPLFIYWYTFYMAFPKKGALNLHRIVLNNINVLIIPEIISIDTYNILH